MATLNLALGNLRENVSRADAFCRQRGLQMLLVTKILQSRPDILSNLGCGHVADVHGENFQGLDPQRFPTRAVLRPRFGKAETVAAHATRVFLSDPKLAEVLGEARRRTHPNHPLQVTLMVETGDLRDGVPWDDLPAVVRRVAQVPGLELEGLGTNFGCLAGAIPDVRALETMAEGLLNLRKATGHPLPGFSLGGTVFWDLFRDTPLPPEFTEFRVGEAVFFAWNTSLQTPIPEMASPVFTLDLEVLEIWEKHVAAFPPGPPGYNAFGERAAQLWTGPRRRAVLDGGENMAPLRSLKPLDPGLRLVGETHEYTVVDCQETDVSLGSGDYLRFHPGYEAVARCFLSPHLDFNIGE